MITCNILGPDPNSNNGLGNQLFCVAATLSLAKQNNYKAVFPDLNYDPYRFYAKTIFHKLDKSVSNKNFIKSIYREAPYTSTVYEPIQHTDNLCAHGYFQSYKYFEKDEKYIKDLFTLPNSMIQEVDIKYGFLYDMKTVSVHIRRTDYLQLKHHYEQMNWDYYITALEHINKKVKYDKIVVFSDDIEWVKNNFIKTDKKVFFIEDGCDVVELFLMSKMKHNIIANSTFSWWGAYLNENPQKEVVAPKLWFKDPTRSTKDLVPKTWTRI
tara:strand:- start:1616 stop:2419 length:804 start_codon:yes stop_codon:yes gene_type:complete